MRRAAIALAVGVALAAPAAVTPSAEASFHLMKIEEIDTGQPGQPELQFVDLQMYQSNQNVVGGHTSSASTRPAAPRRTARSRATCRMGATRLTS